MKTLMSVCIIACLCVAGHSPYMLVKIENELNTTKKAALYGLALDIIGTEADGSLKAVLHPHEIEKLKNRGIGYEVLIDDMERYYASKMRGTTNFGNYHTYSESNAILDDLHNRFPSITSKRIDLGVTTLQGNKLWAMKISDNPDLDEDEPEILFTGAHHAREPIGVNLCDTLVKILCEGYASDENIKYLVDNREIWVVPVVNPDGYLYNEEQNPGGGGMWRKNRRDNGDGTFGVDPNRNYSFKWGFNDGGSSPDPSAETYRGAAAFSEPCNQGMRDFFNAHKFSVCVHFHSYGNYVIYPWGYTWEKSPDDALFERLSKDMFDLAAAATGQEYEYGTIPEVLYSVNGNAEDWAYGEQTSKPKCLSFCFEIGEEFWQEESIEEHLTESVPMCMYLIRVVGRWLRLASYTIKDGGNNQLDPNETAEIIVELENNGIIGGAFNTVSGTLKSKDNFVTIINSSGSFGSIALGQTGSNSGKPFSIKTHALTPQGHKAQFTLEIVADGGFKSEVPFTIVVGTPRTPIILFQDNFDYQNSVDSFAINWDASGNWHRASDHVYSGTHAASSGSFLKTNSLIMKPTVNLSVYMNPELSFCVRGHYDWPEDWKYCEVSLSSNGGTTWEDFYTIKGNKKDTLWLEKNFSLASYTTDNVKVRFVVDAIGVIDSAKFWIDDVRIFIPYDNEPPAFLNTTLWPETYKTGPFLVSSIITDINTVAAATLNYRVQSGSWKTLTMNNTSKDIYEATIPAQNGTGTIDYFLEARDEWPVGKVNTGCFPVGASQNSGYHSFIYGSTGIIQDNLAPTVFFAKYGNGSGITISYSLPQAMHVTLCLYNVMGKRVAKLLDKKASKGNHRFTWKNGAQATNSIAAGLYFLSMTTGKVTASKTVTKLIIPN